MAAKIKYNEMSTMAIYIQIDKLHLLYDLAIKNNIKTIVVPAWVKSIDIFMSESVLTHVLDFWKLKDAKKFINKVRQHHKVHYDYIMTSLISENNNKKDKVKKIIKLADSDNYHFDYQKLINTALECDNICANLLKKEADKKNYILNFNAMDKNNNSIDKLVNWCKEKNQILDLNIQALIEDLSLHNIKYLEYYLELNKSYNQKLNFDRILDLFNNEEMITLIKKFIPNDYVYETYPENLVIDLGKYKNEELKNIIDDLIKYCYHTTNITYIIYKKRKYYNSTNLWYTRKEQPGDENRDYDEDECCQQYESCVCDKIIYPSNSDKIKYVIDYDKTLTKFNHNYINEELIRKISHINPSNIILSGFDKITLHNPCGINTDHRGSDHCKIHLQYYYEYMMKCPINLLTFANNLYRVKSHKWDIWYELYCKVKTIHIDCIKNNDKDKPKSNINIIMDFDHGS